MLVRMKTISLTQGKVAIVDDEDFMAVEGSRWRARRNNHGQWCVIGKRGGKSVIMSRLIMNAPRGIHVDHRSGDVFDNRRCNLRLCTNQQNSWNRRSRTGSSNFKGVSFCRNSGKWRVSIGLNYKKYQLGVFSSEREAAEMYNIAAQVVFGEFALLNKV